VRVVKSQKDRKWDSMKEGIVRIRNARKNSDWPMIQDEFANVNKLVEKSKMLIIQSGLPPFYIKMLAEVEDHVQLALKDKEAIKKMKPVVSRALNQMKLQVRKHNETYKAEIADCRANPDKYQEAEEEESSSSSSESSSDSDSDDSDSDSDASSESEKPKAAAAKAPAAKKPAAKVITFELMASHAVALHAVLLLYYQRRVYERDESHSFLVSELPPTLPEMGVPQGA
jgi:translation initiation factor 3 subunit C